jgi:hypothetical protein
VKTTGSTGMSRGSFRARVSEIKNRSAPDGTLNVRLWPLQRFPAGVLHAQPVWRTSNIVWRIEELHSAPSGNNKACCQANNRF